MQVQFEKIPPFLKSYAQFCNWKYEQRDGNQTKVPYIPGTTRRADVSNPATFAAFDAAASATGYDGIGIRVSGRIVGIDLDHCIENGKLLPWAQPIVDRFKDTYIEISPSGTGLRIFCLLPGDFSYDTQTYYIKHGDIEVYIPGHTNRFLTVTGNALTEADVAETAEALVWLLDAYMRRPTPPIPSAAVPGTSYTPAREPEDIYAWQQRTVADILVKMEYLGHTANFKTKKKSYKSKKKVNNDPSEWVIFKNTHEAIIDQETFEIVQNIRNGRRRLTPMGEMPVLSGMLFCADCGAKLYQVRSRGWTHEQEHFVCATYRKRKGKCTSHQIRNVQVEQILLTEINRMLAFVRERESEFGELLTKKNERDLNRQFRECSRELEQATQRITKLDSIIQRLYEDNLDGKISDERFAKMTATYEQEQKDLEARVIVLRETLSKAKA